MKPIEELISRIHKHVFAHLESPLSYDVASELLIEKAERSLKLSIPPLLRECYKCVANGGFGPGYGLIGLENGAKSDFGTLVETYEQLKSDQELEGGEWDRTLLPFCDWGCNIFSCVDCADPEYHVYTFRDFSVVKQSYTIEEFFEMWLKGVDILSVDSKSLEESEFINPFTGEKASVTRQK